MIKNTFVLINILDICRDSSIDFINIYIIYIKINILSYNRLN